MESIPIILVRFFIVKYVNESLAAVYVTQGLVMVPNTISLLDAESVVENILVALQIDGEFVGQNAEKLMG